MNVTSQPEPHLPDTPEYRVHRAQQALARDPRTLELGLDVSVRGDQVFVTGVVASESRRVAVADVVSETLPGLAVHNHSTVIPIDQPAADEHIE
jgi:hypothetical protein